MTRVVRAAVVTSALAALAAWSGCALTSKSTPEPIYWFSPETVHPRLTSAAPPSPTREAGAPLLRLGRVTGADHLRERIVYRDEGHVVGFYEDLRWTERPEVYVRREIARALFEDRGFDRALSGLAPTLDVELLAFDEIKLTGLHAARIQVRIVLAEGGRALVEETMTIDEPFAGNQTSAFVAAMAQALSTMGARVADRVAGALAASPRPGS